MNISLLQQKIGNRIRELRESKGISQQNLAAICNFEKANLSRLEAGRTNPTISTLYKISQALEITITELVDVEAES
ncbi:helix-turn-helix transcriptional regulator [Draconibacterium sp. IB214405]|uniref:helix-turn-helix domain-containing protein n=1 Tax=Draconibacterium sp. IB214405 TaxID=3097352 RepID=UPI002A169DFA|nr:helix-turn-helix transcriptional regulator [Draconibacterium sp. IB214405]MDX8338782.1 helix-turn-helix transcriptional regulator [Draconibacterium sp. IB214405]